jgi:CheY-like chemotaxis protein
VTPGTGQAELSSGTTRRVNSSEFSLERPRRILIVEDDASVRLLLGFVLLREGWSVTSAANGSDAIAQLERSQPDIILLDMSMPGLDGWDVLARRVAEATWSQVPVIVMSANHLYAKAVLDLGATSFLPKPFSIEQLKQALLEVLPPR